MGTIAPLLTVDDFLALPEKPGFKLELHEGMVVEMPSGRLRHEIVKSNLVTALTLFISPKRAGRVFSETMFVLTEDASYIPDVSFVSKERMLGRDLSLQFQGAPDIAIEVVSSDSAAYLARKTTNYLKHGSKAVWVVYPDELMVHAFDSQGNPRRLAEGQFLEEPDLLPGFHLPVQQIFEGI